MTPLTPDFVIASILYRLVYYRATNLKESVNEYGLLVNLWTDMCGSTASFVTTVNLLEGHSTISHIRTCLAAGAIQVFCIFLLHGIVGVL